MRTKVKAHAKINLTLDVLGKEQGYHKIDSIVTSVNIADVIVLSTRKDKKINLKVKGGLDIKTEENNAYKCLKLVMEETGINGFNLKIKKKIPVGGGLGGSSCDISGVLNAVSRFYLIDKEYFAEKLGSDTVYMLYGGTARISERGNTVKKLNRKLKFYLVMLNAEKGVSSKRAYELFDGLSEKSAPITSIAEKDISGIEKYLKNDLYFAVAKENAKIKQNYEILSKFAPTVMTGSGSIVYSLFKSKKERNKVYRVLKKQNLKPIKAKTI